MEQGLIVHAGHGLTYRNIAAVARIEGLCEFNIGHSIVSRAVLVGIREATRQMIELIDKYAEVDEFDAFSRVGLVLIRVNRDTPNKSIEMRR